jgi:ribosome-associated protein
MTCGTAVTIRITTDIIVNESELEEEFIRASGPGGQHVNKAATAVQLRFDAANSLSLPQDVRKRLARLAGRLMTADGVLIIEANRFRSQERNRQDARDRLIGLIRRAARRPRLRRKTGRTGASMERRLRDKRHRAKTKQLRQPPTADSGS